MHNKPWTDAEDRAVQTGVKKKLSDSDIGALIGRSTQAVKCRRLFLFIRRPNRGRPLKVPTPSGIDQAKKLLAHEIALAKAEQTIAPLYRRKQW